MLKLEMINKLLVITIVLFLGITVVEVGLYMEIMNKKAAPAKKIFSSGFTPTVQTKHMLSLNDENRSTYNPKVEIFNHVDLLSKYSVNTKAIFTVEYGGTIKKALYNQTSSGKSSNKDTQLVLTIGSKDSNAKDLTLYLSTQLLEEAILKDKNGKLINYTQLKEGKTVEIKTAFDFVNNIDLPMEIKLRDSL